MWQLFSLIQKKAYDTTWKRGILNNLYELGFRGRLANFIEGFLQNRTFKVRAGSAFSDSHKQDMGVPQGSILGPILFLARIYDMPKCLTKDTLNTFSRVTGYADDTAVYVKAKHFNFVAIISKGV